MEAIRWLLRTYTHEELAEVLGESRALSTKTVGEALLSRLKQEVKEFFRRVQREMMRGDERG